MSAACFTRYPRTIDARFVLGLTATPERADGADVLGLFDDHVAHQAGIAEGIRLERLVPFHYFGIKDTIDYELIPWRNRRFDPDALELAAETEARMASLWAALSAHPGARTIVFCCGVRHAEFVKRWLTERGVAVRAIHTGSTDDRTEALEALGAGTIEAICAVDVLNEGVDVPAVDRVVMLRPTESSVVFLQQLGRGLRSSPATGKKSVAVIDFVGNHRLFLERIRTLLSLGGGSGALRALLATPSEWALPDGCSVELELEAKSVLERLFRSGGADEVERAYRELASSREERPRAGELRRLGYSLAALRARHGGWFDFVALEGDLSSPERDALEAGGAFLRELEATPMTRSFKMVTLQALIEHDALETGMRLDELATRSWRVLRRDPTLLADVPETHRGEAPGAGWQSYWRKNPIAAWTSVTKSSRAWFEIRDEQFVPKWPWGATSASAFAGMVAELVDDRLVQYRRRGRSDQPGRAFLCKVTWNQRDPILKLPNRAHATLPEGELDVRLRDGAVWVFRFAKEFCNVARPAGVERNQLPDLLRGWFGPSAGQPGTSFSVRFESGPDGWSVAPEQTAQIRALPRRSVAAYPDLRAAAGHASSPTLATEPFTVALPIEQADPGLFAVRVAGSSMDGGRAPLRDGDWAVFRFSRGASAASVEGRVVLVQVPAEAEGHSYQIKRVVRNGSAWQLRSDNPEGPSFDGDASSVVIARLDRSFHPEDLAQVARGASVEESELGAAFGLDSLETRDARHSGHLFIFVSTPRRFVTPTRVRAAGIDPRPGETAFVLARDGEARWRYLGVGRWSDDVASWTIPEVDVATWRCTAQAGEFHARSPMVPSLPPSRSSLCSWSCPRRSAGSPEALAARVSSQEPGTEVCGSKARMAGSRLAPSRLPTSRGSSLAQLMCSRTGADWTRRASIG